MFGILKRGLAVALFSVPLAACQVIPDSGRPTTTGPVDVPTDVPSDVVLPTDDGRHRVALLVPLGGANGEVGQSIANATTMALLDTNAENLRITTYDTSADAGAAAANAIRDGNALILGPLGRDSVSEVLARTRPAGIPLITFSNDTGVAARDVFVLGHVPEQSIARTVQFAVSQGARRFAALVPNGEYGQRAASALQRAVTAAGAQFVASETYNRGNTSIVSAAGRLSETGGFDTVLIGDGARLASMAAGQLKEAGEALPSIIGPELWSGETALTRNPSMQGAWFSAVSDARYRQFVSSYEARFGNQPYRLATLGYDAVLLTLRIARDWEPGEHFPTGELSDEGGFLGLDGPFRFSRDGVGERAFEVREVGDGTISVVDPAPSQF
jgi:ABC-type branched-subunit amino acid transport system substrate-binding protein